MCSGRVKAVLSGAASGVSMFHVIFHPNRAHPSSLGLHPVDTLCIPLWSSCGSGGGVATRSVQFEQPAILIRCSISFWTDSNSHACMQRLTCSITSIIHQTRHQASAGEPLALNDRQWGVAMAHNRDLPTHALDWHLAPSEACPPVFHLRSVPNDSAMLPVLILGSKVQLCHALLCSCCKQFMGYPHPSRFHIYIASVKSNRVVAVCLHGLQSQLPTTICANIAAACAQALAQLQTMLLGAHLLAYF